MVTDDLEIDRRIIQQAQSLTGCGHHVIMISRWQENLKQFEILDGIRIERFIALPSNLVEKMLCRFLRGLQKTTQVTIDFVLGRRVKTSRSEDQFPPSVTPLERMVLSVLPRRRGLSFHERSLLSRINFYRPDVIHAHDLPQLRACAVAAKTKSIPLVYDAHELYTEIGTLSRLDRLRLKLIERKYIKDCSAVTTVNPYIATEMAHRYKIDHPVVILNAINGPASQDQDNKLRNYLDISDDNELVLYQGWLSSVRGLDLLLKAFVYVKPTAHLVFLGYGDATDLKILVNKLGLNLRVHFAPAVRQDDLLSWTRGANVGVIPYPAVDLNHRLCSPNKLFEFIQSELPIVANDLPFLRDVIVGERIGTVASIHDPHDFADAINSMLLLSINKDPELSASLGHAKSIFDWTTQEESLFSVFNRFV